MLKRATRESGCVKPMVFWILQPLASVTVTEYVPDVKLMMLFVLEFVFHRYEYGDIPPLTNALILPSLYPKQEG
jgi:hypothetical protein